MAITYLNKICRLCERPFHVPRSKPKQIFCSRSCYTNRPPLALESRFWVYVVRKSQNDCWLWTGAKMSRGYGVIGTRRTTTLAHRLSWELHNGPIPKGSGYHGTCVLHRCDNPPCVNPEHLFLGTNAENTADKMAKGRHPRGTSSHMAKLTEEQVIHIRQSKDPHRTIAAKFGISRPNVSVIKHKKSWAHIP